MATLSTRKDASVAVRDLVRADLEMLLLSTLNAVGMGVLLTDLDHTTLACNTHFGDIWQVEHNATVKQNAEEVRQTVLHRIVDFDAWTSNLNHVYADPQGIQTDILHLQNPAAVIRRNTTPVIDKDGTAIARLWTFQDCTKEHRLTEMREILQEAATLFHPEPKVVYEWITEKISGYYQSIALLSIKDGDYMEFRAMGAPPGMVSDAIHGNHLRESYCQFCLEQNGATLIQDARLDPRYQGILPFQLGLTRYLGVPLITPYGGTVGTLCILDNRSDEPLDSEDIRFMTLLAMRVSSELDRERQLGNLQQDLERTSHALQTSEQQLIQNEKLAITGTLAASVAHDIRNILAVIRLEIELGKHDPTATVTTIQTHLQRFNLLSHRLLSYVRPRRVKVNDVDLREVVQSSLTLLKSHLKIGGIEIEIHEPDLPVMVQADGGRLEHLIINLVMNSIQAVLVGGKIIVGVSDDSSSSVLSVVDNGPGMPPEQLEKLFLPFSSTRADGFGLGLYSCLQIAKEANGEIQVASSPGNGTRFTVTFRK